MVILNVRGEETIDNKREKREMLLILIRICIHQPIDETRNLIIKNEERSNNIISKIYPQYHTVMYQDFN
jgi:hypothetical protein